MFFWLFFLISPSRASELKVTLYYPEKPPYYYASPLKAEGFLLEKAKKIFATSHISVEINKRPILRILKDIEKNNNSICGLGFFKTKDREQAGIYSEPIFQELPMKVIVPSIQKPIFSKIENLDQLIQFEKAHGVFVNGASYGEEVDQLLSSSKNTHFVPDFQKSLLLISKNRGNWTLVNALEFDYFIQNNPAMRDLLTEVSLKKMPAGNKRYLYCSKKVTESMMTEINKAIRHLESHSPQI